MAAKKKDADDLELDADAAIGACGGDPREAVKALIVTNRLLWSEVEKSIKSASTGYSRGKIRNTN